MTNEEIAKEIVRKYGFYMVRGGIHSDGYLQGLITAALDAKDDLINKLRETRDILRDEILNKKDAQTAPLSKEDSVWEKRYRELAAQLPEFKTGKGPAREFRLKMRPDGLTLLCKALPENSEQLVRIERDELIHVREVLPVGFGSSPQVTDEELHEFSCKACDVHFRAATYNSYAAEKYRIGFRDGFRSREKLSGTEG